VDSIAEKWKAPARAAQQVAQTVSNDAQKLKPTAPPDSPKPTVADQPPAAQPVEPPKPSPTPAPQIVAVPPPKVPDVQPAPTPAPVEPPAPAPAAPIAATPPVPPQKSEPPPFTVSPPPYEPPKPDAKMAAKVAEVAATPPVPPPAPAPTAIAQSATPTVTPPPPAPSVAPASFSEPMPYFKAAGSNGITDEVFSIIVGGDCARRLRDQGFIQVSDQLLDVAARNPNFVWHRGRKGVVFKLFVRDGKDTVWEVSYNDAIQFAERKKIPNFTLRAR